MPPWLEAFPWQGPPPALGPFQPKVPSLPPTLTPAPRSPGPQSAVVPTAAGLGKAEWCLSGE